MYCRNSVSLHLIRGVCALMLVLALFLFQFPLFAKLACLACVVFLLLGCPACWFSGLIYKLKNNKA